LCSANYEAFLRTKLLSGGREVDGNGNVPVLHLTPCPEDLWSGGGTARHTSKLSAPDGGCEWSVACFGYFTCREISPGTYTVRG